MIYIPILKNRRSELAAIKKCSGFLGPNIVPYFEIIRDYYIDRFASDKFGRVIMELKPGNKRKTRVKLPHTIEDICTLSQIDSNVNHSNCFIEYYRLSDEDYANRSADFQGIELAMELTRDYNKYAQKTIEICKFENFTPVISIKQTVRISEYDLRNLINQIHQSGHSVGIRLQLELIDDYIDFIKKELTNSDYLFVDIGESRYFSQKYLLDDIIDYNIPATLILFNSPRSSTTIKREFQRNDWEPLIDNSVAVKYSDSGFAGFGDYAGLKDVLPETIPVRSCILALIYDWRTNQFWSIRSESPSDGFSVRQVALLKSKAFDKTGECKAFEEIRNISSGSQAKWNEITVIRYINQIYNREQIS